MKPTDYDSKAQTLIHDLLKELDKSQAIIPTKVGTQNQELQTTRHKVTGKKGKYVRKKSTTKERLQDTEVQPTQEKRQEEVGTTVEVGTTLDLVEELKKRNELQKQYKKAVEKEVKNTILFQPHPGPQTDFLASTEYEVGFFGGRASGKSICLLVDPLRFVDNRNFKGLLLRKTMPALREIISRAKQLYPKVKPGTKWKEAEKLFEFPSGATIEFGYYDHIDDYDRYHGREFAWLGIDEITQWSTQEYYDRIKSVVRSTDPLLDPRIRATCNPSGPGRGWVKEYFNIEPNIKTKSIRTEYEVLGQMHSISRKYIISTVFDNPSTVENDPQYIAFLQSLPPAQKKQWLDGDFEAVDGLAFEEFSTQTHVIDPFPVPAGWLKVRAIDWGFRGKAVCLWAAFNKEGQAFLYRELVTTKVHSDTFAKMVLELEQGEYVSYGVVDGQAGVQTGINGPTVEEDFLKHGLVNQHADKKAGSRMHSKQLLHKYLRVDPETGEPMLKIFSTCRQIIKELGSLMVDPHNSEDIDQRQDDDAYDTLRYLLSSRPDPDYAGDPFTDTNRYKQSMPIIVNSKYGY